MTNASRPRTLLKLGLAAGVFALGLGLVEVALRVAGFRYHLYPERIQFGYPEPEVFEEGYFLPHERFLWVSRKYADILAAARETPPDVVMMGCSCTEWGEIDLGLARLSRRAGGGWRGEPVRDGGF